MMKRCLSALICLVLMSVCAFAWGEKGHEMSARIAVRSLPGDMPQFFRNAGKRLVYLCPEPDRWFTYSSPALLALNAPDHYFDMEVWGSDRLPPSRYDLVVLGIQKGIIHYDPLAPREFRNAPAPNPNKYVSDLGTAPYAVAEMAGKLVVNLKQWRDASDDTEAARTIKQQLQESVIYLAGVLGHYVTDLGNPLHCTVHHNGWAEGYPNPKGFAAAGRGQSLHARFESIYVGRAISEKDIEPLLSAPHRVGPWVAGMEQFLRRNNGFVEELYTLEEKGAFGSGQEPAEAKAFTAARLADSASMLRDVWQTAWAISGEEWLNDRATFYPEPGKTVLELLRARYHVVTETNNGLVEVVQIGNRKNGLDGRHWQMYLNNAPARQPVDEFVPAAGDRVDFRFEKTAAVDKAA